MSVKNSKEFLVELEQTIVLLKKKYKIRNDRRMNLVSKLMDDAKECMLVVPCERCNKRRANGMYWRGDNPVVYACDKCGEEVWV
jgi:hypothetical protein